MKLSAHKSIQSLPLPSQVFISLQQHLGAPAKPLVKKGDTVKTGQLIGEANGFISANVHASVTGKVIKIEPTFDASGYRHDAIIIQTTEKEEWEEGIDTTDTLIEEIPYSSQEIIEKIKQAGIVGLGGATFPSHVKLTIPSGKKAEYLLINGAECEPYLTADHVLMKEKPKEIIVGIKILMKALGVTQCLIGIEQNKPDAIHLLTTLSEKEKGMKVIPLKTKYPQGGEKQLIKAILNREVPIGGLPIDVGTVVFNVGTTFAVYQAVQKNMPLIQRIVTVTGKNLKNPANYIVRIGTPVSHLLEASGGLPENTGKIISGGPMMGKALLNAEIPVSKGSSGILTLQEKESHRAPVEPCIRCAKCINVCPMGLEPYLLMPLAQKQAYEKLHQHNIMSCIECGSCSYTCPAHRPLLDYIRYGKSEVGKRLKNKKL